VEIGASPKYWDYCGYLKNKRKAAHKRQLFENTYT
jgi:hypothetical protein